MSETFNYLFSDGTGTDTVNVTASTPATDSTGAGLGYPVTAISGAIDGVPITGEVGAGGDSSQVDQYGNDFDNTIFTSNSAGVPGNSTTNSSYGIDTDGLEFTAGGVEYNLYYNQNVFFLYDGGSTAGTPLALATNSSDAPCYCPGTLILTDRGEQPIEELAIGDRVATVSGLFRPIRWIGRRTYGQRFVRRNPALWPVCLRAGCLGEGLPRRDLFVSPHHAMFLGGVLIPAGLLLNAISITRVQPAEALDYIHIELDEHAVIWAEGAPSESFLDDNSRLLFHNATEFAALYPGDRASTAGFCAPRVEEGEALEAVKRAIDERARSWRHWTSQAA